MTETHERFYRSQLADVDRAQLLIQPYNHGTAPAIAYCLTHLHQIDPDALVGFFPSDHHFADDEAFAARVDLAFTQTELEPARVILLGIKPDAPEESYGWIEPGESLAGGAAYEVRCFWEKPSRRVAARLMQGGCLWNSFVMVGRVSTFLAMIRRTLPGLLNAFESISSGSDMSALRQLYSEVPASNFSDEVLSKCPEHLAVLPAYGLGWSDLGEPQRVLAALRIPKMERNRQRANRNSESLRPVVEVPA